MIANICFCLWLPVTDSTTTPFGAPTAVAPDCYPRPLQRWQTQKFRMSNRIDRSINQSMESIESIDGHPGVPCIKDLTKKLNSQSQLLAPFKLTAPQKTWPCLLRFVAGRLGLQKDLSAALAATTAAETLGATIVGSAVVVGPCCSGSCKT